jgi:hypothetical protein
VQNSLSDITAGVLVITLLLRGLGADVFEMIADDLKNIYQLLKLIKNTDPDEITRVHADIALKELDAIVHSSLSPPSQKSILML